MGGKPNCLLIEWFCRQNNSSKNNCGSHQCVVLFHCIAYLLHSIQFVRGSKALLAKQMNCGLCFRMAGHSIAKQLASKSNAFIYLVGMPAANSINSSKCICGIDEWRASRQCGSITKANQEMPAKLCCRISFWFARSWIETNQHQTTKSYFLIPFQFICMQWFGWLPP